MSGTDNWKNSERSIAELYQRFGIEDAFRVSRAANYSVSDYDVRIPQADWVKTDSKYSKKPWRSHSLMKEGQGKYAKKLGEEFVLYTKGFRERSGFITVRAELFAALLSFWIGCKTKEQLIKLLSAKGTKESQ